MSVWVKIPAILMLNATTRLETTPVSVHQAFLEMEQPVKVWYIVWLNIMLCEPILLLVAVEEESEESQSQFSVVAIVLSVLGCLLLLTLIIILVFYVIVRITKLLPVYWKRNMRSGIGKLCVV